MGDTLTFNGYVLDVKIISSVEVEEIGVRRGRDGRGGPTKAIEHRRYRHEFETIIQTEEESRALVRFLYGVGFACPMDGGFHGIWNPIKPEPGYQDYHFSQGTGQNADSVVIASAQTMTYKFELTDRYTIIARCQHAGDGLWHTYAYEDAGLEYKDGTPGSYSQLGTWFTIDGSGSLIITGKNESGVNAAFRWDEIVALPWRATPAMLDAWTTDNTNPFSPLPKLRVEGDFIRTGEAFVICSAEVNGGPYIDATIDGTHDSGGRTIRFTLTEEPRWL